MNSSWWTLASLRRLFAVVVLALALPLSFGNVLAWAETDADADGVTVEQGDCNDTDPTVYPGAPEAPDGQDNDCDGFVDEDVPLTYRDADEDGFGNPHDSVPATAHYDGASNWSYSTPEGYVLDSTDCDDSDPATYPGAVEIFDGKDNDCDGLIDESGLPRWYVDADFDGFGDPNQWVEADLPPEGYVADSTDCDDADPMVYPGAEEFEDGKDNDCNGLIDEYYSDIDGDGLPDEVELQLGTDPYLLDTDDDSIGDWIETDGGVAVDTDRDGLIDARDLDSDNDRVPDSDEGDIDTDADGVADYRDLDSDDDGVTDRVDNCRLEQNLEQEDLDEDGLGDVCDFDDDGDGLEDIEEGELATNPRDPDSDDDGLNDGEEVRTVGSDPLDADSDGDLASDRTEVAYGSDPTNPLSVPLPTNGNVTLTREPPVGEIPVADDLGPLY